jgi:PAS domain S-box-containing protein
MSMVAHLHWASGEERFRTLYQLVAALSRASTLADVYDVALTSLLDATAADRAALLLFDDDGVIRLKASKGLSAEYQRAVTGHSPWLRGTRDAQPLLVPDVFADEGLRGYREVLLREGIRAIVFVPLALDAGVFGKFMLYYAEPHECTTDELEIANTIAAHAALASERKRLEIAGLHLAAIVESSEDAIISKNLSGIVTSWNNGAQRIFGYTAAEIVGQPVSILAAPDRLDEMPEILSKIKQGLRVEHYETRRRRKNGEIIDVALTVSPVRDGSGRIVGASKIARDISDRKQAEEKRALLLAREQEARRTAELLNQAAPRLSAQLELEKLIQEVTDIASTLVGAEFGWLNTEFPAATFAGERVVRSDDVALDPRYRENSPDLGLPQQGVPPGLTLRSYLAAPVKARSGEILGGLCLGHSAPGKFTAEHAAIVIGIAAQAAIAMDNARLFEQAQWAQAELKRSNEELRRSNQDLEVFAYSASHDLQEPLRTISLSAQIIERNFEGRLLGDDSAILGNIRAASKRMSALIEDLLAYTKAMKYEGGPAPTVDSARTLANVLENMWGALEESGAVVTSGELPMVAIHEARLAQLFQNLISNAIKYRGEEIPRVEVRADDRDGWCVFSVVDNGIGIEAQYADQIFGLFKRLHGGDRYPGSGIGLAICQRVVEQYRGRIWLEQSTLGGGSTFCFALPSRPR